jgi:pimeloyl-ACP methyl ester carboxylesterase
VKDRYFPGRGIAYRVNELRADRQTLLFVHGLSGSLSAWEPYEKLLEHDCNVITLDLRGHGLSVHPGRSGYRMQEFVEDIRVLLEHLQVAHCSIVSHSFGTLVAMEFTRAHPTMVERNVLLSPAYGVRHFKITRLLSNLAAALAMAPLRMRGYNRTDYARFYPTPDYSLARIGTDILNMGVRSYLYAMRIIFEKNYDPDWLSLSVPTLIVHGSLDTIIPAGHARELGLRLPGSRLAEINGANHILVLNNVDEVTRLIREFLGQ